MKTQLKNIAHQVIDFYRSRYFTSTKYWENRYTNGNNSGNGSYGKLAKFKAEVLNQFIADNNIERVLEFGCGDGNQLSLAHYETYTGLDVSPAALQICKQKYEHDNSKSFFLYEPTCFVDHASIFQADLTLSLDVIFHIIEDDLFHLYMTHLFASAEKYAIVYSSNCLPDASEKVEALHVKHRVFTDWIAEHAPGWRLHQKIDNRYPLSLDPDGSPSDFYIYKRTSP